AEAGAVHLHARIAMVTLDRFGAAENLDAAAAIHNFRAHLAATRIDADGFARHARLEKSRGHAIGRPRLLRAGLEDETDLHRYHRHPKRVHTRRVGGQDEAKNRRLRLVADNDAARFHAVAARENLEVKAAREA